MVNQIADNRNQSSELSNIYNYSIQVLSKIENPEFEVRQLLKHFFGLSDSEIYLKEKVIAADLTEFYNAIELRKTGYPLQYIFGNWEFYGYKFKVGEGVLIPRADTETLIDFILETVAKEQKLNIIDLCSGTGCIAITLRHLYQNSTITAIEKSETAFKYLKENIELNAVKINAINKDIFDFQTKEYYDIIVSNPPYLTKSDMENLQKEVKYEPSMALYGYEDGLYFYKKILKTYKEYQKKGSYIFFEFGILQEDAIAELLKENQYEVIGFKKDYNGIIRAICGKKQ